MRQSWLRLSLSRACCLRQRRISISVVWLQSTKCALEGRLRFVPTYEGYCKGTCVRSRNITDYCEAVCTKALLLKILLVWQGIMLSSSRIRERVSSRSRPSQGHPTQWRGLFTNQSTSLAVCMSSARPKFGITTVEVAHSCGVVRVLTLDGVSQIVFRLNTARPTVCYGYFVVCFPSSSTCDLRLSLSTLAIGLSMGGMGRRQVNHL